MSFNDPKSGQIRVWCDGLIILLEKIDPIWICILQVDSSEIEIVEVMDHVIREFTFSIDYEYVKVLS